MKKLRIRYVLTITMIFGSLLFGCSQSGEREIHFFYEIVCASCDETERMERLATRLMELRRKRPELSVDVHDLSLESGRTAYERIISESRVAKESMTLPVLLVGKEIYPGEDAVRKRLTELEEES